MWKKYLCVACSYESNHPLNRIESINKSIVEYSLNVKQKKRYIECLKQQLFDKKQEID